METIRNLRIRKYLKVQKWKIFESLGRGLGRETIQNHHRNGNDSKTRKWKNYRRLRYENVQKLRKWKILKNLGKENMQKLCNGKK